ncbi:hypothetical protein NDU88_001946 [Pleurodeles waltl]|uniref:Uncharacterized protein n=1 Tax=Pleurodeles waltl TaxID=8319 RepID=A0AAV7WJV5_PLEWA|nr:hypothetical protein NDU88_001946 [Pleurodeles waltl]
MILLGRGCRVCLEQSGGWRGVHPPKNMRSCTRGRPGKLGGPAPGGRPIGSGGAFWIGPEVRGLIPGLTLELACAKRSPIDLDCTRGTWRLPNPIDARRREPDMLPRSRKSPAAELEWLQFQSSHWHPDLGMGSSKSR